MGGSRVKDRKRLAHSRITEEASNEKSERLNSSSTNRRVSRSKRLLWTLAFIAGVNMGVGGVFLPKVAAADVKKAKVLINKQNAVLDEGKKLDAYFKEQEKKYGPDKVGATTYTDEAKAYMKAVSDYLSAMGVPLEGKGAEKIKALNEYLGVKVDGKTPDYLVPETIAKMNEKMDAELNPTMSDPAAKKGADDLNAITYMFEEAEEPTEAAPPPTEAVAAPVEADKELLAEIDKYFAYCEQYNLESKYMEDLMAFRTHAEAGPLSEKESKQLKKLEKAIDAEMKAADEEIAKAEEAEKKKAEKKAAVVTTDLQKTAEYMSILMYATKADAKSGDYLIFKKLFSGKAPKNLLKNFEKYYKKLASGEELKPKEKKALEKLFADTEKWLANTLIPTLEKYSPLLVGEPKEVYDEKMEEINKHLETKMVPKGKKQVEVRTIKDGHISEIIGILLPAESEQEKFSPLNIVANEYYLVGETLRFVKMASGQLATKNLKKQDKATWEQLNALKNQSSALFTQLTKKNNPEGINFQTVAPLLFELESAGRKANMELLEAEKDSIVAKKPLPQSIQDLIDDIVDLRLARVEISEKKKTPTLADAKKELADAIELAEEAGMEENIEFKFAFEDEPREVSLIEIAKNLMSTGKDPARLYEAAQALLAITEAQIWINNSGSLGWIHNTEKGLEGAEESLKLAYMTFEWNFAKEEPLTKDISISRRLAYNSIHVVAPLLTEYEKYLFAEKKQSDGAMVKDGVETAVILKNKKEGTILLMSGYFEKQPKLFGPGVGRGVEAPYFAFETEETLNPSGNGVVVGELERQEDWFNSIKDGKYGAIYAELVALSLEYGNIARGIQAEYEEAKSFLEAIRAEKEDELGKKVDEVKILEAKASVSQVDVPLEEFEKSLKEYKVKLNEEKLQYRFNQDFLKKKSTQKYMKKNPAKASEWTSQMEKWDAEIKQAEAYLEAAEAFVEKSKGKETVTIGIDPEIFNAVKWIDENVGRYDDLELAVQQIALLEAGLDAIVIPGEEGDKPPLQPAIPVIHKFTLIEEGPWPVDPTFIAIKSTIPDYTFTTVSTDTWAGTAGVDAIAANAPDLYGDIDKAREVLNKLADAAAISLSKTATPAQVKEVASDLLETMPPTINTADTEAKNKYEVFRAMIEEAASTGDKGTLRAAVKGLSEDPNIGGFVESEISFFKFDAETNSLLYQPIGVTTEYWFKMDKELIKELKEGTNERKAAILGSFIKLAGTYMKYPGEFVKVDAEGNIIKGAEAESYPGWAQEAGIEVSGGTMVAFKNVVVTFRVQASIKEEKITGEINGEKEEITTSFFSIDIVDATLTLPNGKVFKGAGVGFVKPLTIATGGTEALGGLNPIAHITLGWDKETDKMAGGIYFQPGIIFYGQNLEGVTAEDLVYFGAVHGNLMFKLDEKKALNFKTAITGTSQSLKDIPGLETRAGVELYIKASDKVTIGVTAEGSYEVLFVPDDVSNEKDVEDKWNIFFGLKIMSW